MSEGSARESEPRAWYAVYTRGRHEKKVARALSNKAVPVFLPLARKRSRWKDRWKIVDVPLFTSYLFVNARPDPGSQLAVLKTPGVVRIVGINGVPSPVPDEQIDSLRIVVESGEPVLILRSIPPGARVVVRQGPFEGVIGKVVRLSERKARLGGSLELLNRSVAVELDEDWLERVN